MATLGAFTKMTCTRCPESDRAQFPLDKRRPNGIGPWCCACVRAYQRMASKTPEARHECVVRQKRGRDRARLQRILDLIAAGNGVRVVWGSKRIHHIEPARAQCAIPESRHKPAGHVYQLPDPRAWKAASNAV